MKGQFEVDLPAGGRLELQNAEEVRYWEDSAKRYVQDYGLIKANDLVLLGAILAQGIAMRRAMDDLNDPKRATSAVTTIGKASEQIRELEKALGIDKKTREAGGRHTVEDYVTTLKRAAHERGVHISKRVKAYEELAMGLRWRIRLLRNGDAEDQGYMGISEPGIIAWAEAELQKLEVADKKWATEKGRLWIGRL